MFDLAHNIHGDPFDPPASATAWRVRRLKPRGAPEAVYGLDGLPLVLPLDAAPEDLRQSVSEPGRYRLDPIDENHRPLDTAASSGYLYVYPHHLRNAAVHDGPHAPSTVAPRDLPRASTNMEAAFIEMAKVVTTMAQTVMQAMTSQFPAMLESAAVLIRAADGAGLPARPPMAIEDPGEDDEDENDDEEPVVPPTPVAPGPDLATVIAQALPAVLAAFANRNNTPPPTAPSAPAELTGNLPGAGQRPSQEVPPAEALAHFEAIQKELTPQESTLARATVAELAPADARAWLGQLATLSVPTATARVRALLHSEPTPTEAAAPSIPIRSVAEPQATKTNVHGVPPEAQAHFAAIARELTPRESALARAMVAELDPADARAWLGQLATLSVPKATARIRALLHSEPRPTAPLPVPSS